MILYLNKTDGVTKPPVVAGQAKLTLRNLSNLFLGMIGVGQPKGTIRLGYDAVQASGTVTLSSASGDVTATINGVVSTVTWASSDTNTASLLAAKINAGGDTPNALVTKHVTATSALGVVTITAIQAGDSGNAITLDAGGTGATKSGTKLTGGTQTTETYTFP
jgi:phage tail sheath gpL-like